MELVVIRHGETRANAEGRYLGALDMGLNETGWEQVGTLAQELVRERPFQRLLSSPLLRARQSAEVISRALALPVQVIPAFRERHVGVFEGLRRQRRGSVTPSSGRATSPVVGTRHPPTVSRWMP